MICCVICSIKGGIHRTHQSEVWCVAPAQVLRRFYERRRCHESMCDRVVELLFHSILGVSQAKDESYVHVNDAAVLLPRDSCECCRDYFLSHRERHGRVHQDDKCWLQDCRYHHRHQCVCRALILRVLQVVFGYYYRAQDKDAPLIPDTGIKKRLTTQISATNSSGSFLTASIMYQILFIETYGSLLENTIFVIFVCLSLVLGP